MPRYTNPPVIEKPTEWSVLVNRSRERTEGRWPRDVRERPLAHSPAIISPALSRRFVVDFLAAALTHIGDHEGPRAPHPTSNENRHGFRTPKSQISGSAATGLPPTNGLSAGTR